MHKKYFFFDIDGTLSSKQQGGEISTSTIQTLQALKAEGHFLALATGRAYATSKHYLKQFGFQNMVCDGGNGIVLEGKLQGIDPLPLNKAKALIEECENKQIPWGVSYEDSPIRWCVNHEFMNQTQDVFMETKVDSSLDYRSLKQIFKIYIACDEQAENKLVLLNTLPYARYHPHYVFVEPDDKAKGIIKVMDYYQAPYEDVVVFGDGKNDLKMFCKEWTSIAMGNAIPALKAKADFVTKSVNDDGIAFACQHFGWIHDECLKQEDNYGDA